LYQTTGYLYYGDGGIARFVTSSSGKRAGGGGEESQRRIERSLISSGLTDPSELGWAEGPRTERFVMGIFFIILAPLKFLF
jgi:hypothetical protein